MAFPGLHSFGMARSSCLSPHVHGGTTVGALPILIPLVALVATALGLFNVVTTNWSHCPNRACWARRCFVIVFLGVAACCVAMALTWPRGVVPFGLAMAVLFVGAMWPQHVSAAENESI
jgi:hypothetical protein